MEHQSDVDHLVMYLDLQKSRWEARHQQRWGPGVNSFPAASGGGIPQGHRHKELVRRAGYMWKAGMAPEEIEEKLIECNATLCGGHYPDSHIRRIVRSASRWPR
jgi:hypothetical protein